jgi:hypothetical protein
MVDTKKRFLVRDAEIKARSREEGRSWVFWVVDLQNKQTMVWPLVKVRKQDM